MAGLFTRGACWRAAKDVRDIKADYRLDCGSLHVSAELFKQQLTKPQNRAKITGGFFTHIRLSRQHELIASHALQKYIYQEVI
jgi:hypothetical protein